MAVECTGQAFRPKTIKPEPRPDAHLASTEVGVSSNLPFTGIRVEDQRGRKQGFKLRIAGVRRLGGCGGDWNFKIAGVQNSHQKPLPKNENPKPAFGKSKIPCDLIDFGKLRRVSRKKQIVFSMRPIGGHNQFTALIRSIVDPAPEMLAAAHAANVYLQSSIWIITLGCSELWRKIRNVGIYWNRLPVQN
jgi:hypothetical protein